MYKKFVQNLIKDKKLREVVKNKDGYFVPYGINGNYYGKTYRELYLDILRGEY